MIFQQPLAALSQRSRPKSSQVKVASENGEIETFIQEMPGKGLPTSEAGPDTAGHTGSGYSVLVQASMYLGQESALCCSTSGPKI